MKFLQTTNIYKALAISILSIIFTFALSSYAYAHSSSNSYLALSTANSLMTVRADIPLRDIDLIFDLDSNRNGQITWREVLEHNKEIHRWIDQGITLSHNGKACLRKDFDLQVSQHADGIYLSNLSNFACLESINLEKDSLAIGYDLIFSHDALHRGLLKVNFPEYQTSAIFGPDKRVVNISQSDSQASSIFMRYTVEGVWHILIGADHILFLLSLLLLAPFAISRNKTTQWEAQNKFKPVFYDVLAVVSAFTIAHSITLSLSVLKWVDVPASFFEPIIALSIVLTAINNLLGHSALKRWRLAFIFGLIHGFGFASVLLDLGLPAGMLAAALAGFNVGIELGQLLIVILFLPAAWLLRKTDFYRWVIVVGGSLTIIALGIFWMLERLGLLT
jgi:hypothetical protein